MTKLQGILAKNIKRARTRLNYSQMHLSELCGLSTSFRRDRGGKKPHPSPSNLGKNSQRTWFKKPYQLFLRMKNGRFSTSMSILPPSIRNYGKKLTQTWKKP